MNLSDHLQPLLTITAITSTTTVILLLVLAGQLLRGRLRRAAGSLAAIAVLMVVGFAAALPLCNTPLIGVPSP
ncbi:hypothetical protein J2X03_003659 [Microbacterium trichothecenolyticum]|uniref:hypothetical protein n=1 Tax=Microbacterium trichothecenolyticum TaxID=69370 RepID=UPI002862C985|nr:hypothetical protein [Microbacterium trichothecenolyticum]MDR7113759.1 hypothetical protein [Microbacterium trichothecenolyticum]